jgi:hypothetical protein
MAALTAPLCSPGAISPRPRPDRVAAFLNEQRAGKMLPARTSNIGGLHHQYYGSKTARVLTQLLWLGSIAAEGALFVMIGCRNYMHTGEWSKMTAAGLLVAADEVIE